LKAYVNEELMHLRPMFLQNG